MYVLDTNVLIGDARVLEKLAGVDIVIPFIVLEELDKHKSANGMLGASARTVIKLFDKIFTGKNADKGVAIGNKSKIFVRQWDVECIATLNKYKLDDIPDNRIIATALTMIGAKRGVVFLSNDISARLKAASLGISVEGHFKDARPDSVDDIHSGVVNLTTTKLFIDSLYANGKSAVPAKLNVVDNEYVHLTSIESDSQGGLARVVDDRLEVVLPEKLMLGIKPKNMEQQLALNALMNTELNLVTLLGKSGTGKTLLSLASAIELAVNQNRYEKILLIKPIQVIGNDIGYLPGSELEKICVHMSNFTDNLYQLYPSQSRKSQIEFLQYLMDYSKIEVSSMLFMRGRSISNAIIIIDEAQNATPHEIKSLASRLGQNSRLICMGDVNQIDNPSLDATNNGLTHILERFKGQKCAAHITLRKTERSSFADLAGDLL